MQPNDQSLEINEGFKQLARGNLNLLLETEIKEWSEQTNTNLKRAHWENCRQLQTALCVINKGQLILTYIIPRVCHMPSPECAGKGY